MESHPHSYSEDLRFIHVIAQFPLTKSEIKPTYRQEKIAK